MLDMWDPPNVRHKLITQNWSIACAGVLRPYYTKGILKHDSHDAVYGMILPIPPPSFVMWVR